MVCVDDYNLPPDDQDDKIQDIKRMCDLRIQALNQLDKNRDFYLYVILLHSKKQFLFTDLYAMKQISKNYSMLAHKRLDLNKLNYLSNKLNFKIYDVKALQDIKKRIASLKKCLSKKSSCSSRMRKLFQTELEQLRSILKSGTSRSGRSRYFVDFPSIAKKRVMSRIKMSLNLLSDKNQYLAKLISKRLIIDKVTILLKI